MPQLDRGFHVQPQNQLRRKPVQSEAAKKGHESSQNPGRHGEAEERPVDDPAILVADEYGFQELEGVVVLERILKRRSASVQFLWRQRLQVHMARGDITTTCTCQRAERTVNPPADHSWSMQECKQCNTPHQAHEHPLHHTQHAWLIALDMLGKKRVAHHQGCDDEDSKERLSRRDRNHVHEPTPVRCFRLEKDRMPTATVPGSVNAHRELQGPAAPGNKKPRLAGLFGAMRAACHSAAASPVVCGRSSSST